MSDRSLDEFLDAGESDGDGRTPADEDDPGAADGERPDDGGEAAADSVEPATSTYVRDPAGGACEACGETVERRWHSDAGLVCPDCKEW